MNDIENFYKKILLKINQEINNKKIDNAIEIIREELDAPYLPIEYQQIFQKLLNELIADKKYLKIDNVFKNLSKEELAKKIVIKEQINIPAFDYYVSKYNNQYDHIDEYLFSKIFKNEIIDNFIKLHCLRVMRSFNYNCKIIFFNKNIHKSFSVKIDEQWDFEENKYYLNLIKIISDLSFKNPSIYNFELDIAKIIFTYFFNDIPPYSFEKLSEIIHRYVNYSFRDLKVENKHEFDWLEKILENNSSLN